MGHLCTMLGVLYKKMHIGVIRPRIRVRNEISRFLSSGSTARSVLAVWIRARIRAVVAVHLAHHCSEHVSDPKGANGKFMNSTPPFWDLRAEVPGFSDPRILGSENPGAHDLSRYHLVLVCQLPVALPLILYRAEPMCVLTALPP